MTAPQLDPRITTSLAATARAIEEHIATVMAVQAECSHPFVVHKPWERGEFFGAVKARRLCCCCGLEEASSDNFDGFRILTTKFVQEVGNDFYSLRVPHLPRAMTGGN